LIRWGGKTRMTGTRFAFVLAAVTLGAVPMCSQSLASGRPQARSVAVRRLNAAAATGLPKDIEERADGLRAAKRYLEAADDYRAALAMKPANAAGLYNKLGIAELSLQRFREAKGDFERSVKSDRHFAEAYNNLGVVEYLERKYRKAIKQYQKAIVLEAGNASFYSNLGSAYFSKKHWDKSMQAYARALNLDPNIFERRDRDGVAGRIASPQDRAHFSFLLAKLYAKSGLTDRSLECLRRAMEEGYKGVDHVYSDAEFTQLRKDPRFIQLMADRPHVIPE
jgi:tetratricopeptide (TPR) repeat protein